LKNRFLNRTCTHACISIYIDHFINLFTLHINSIKFHCLLLPHPFHSNLKVPGNTSISKKKKKKNYSTHITGSLLYPLANKMSAAEYLQTSRLQPLLLIIRLVTLSMFTTATATTDALIRHNLQPTKRYYESVAAE
jgi:hypothetical protein